MPNHISPQLPEEFAISFGDDDYYPIKNDRRDKRKFIRRSSHYGGEPAFDSFDELTKFFISPAHQDPYRAVGDQGYLADPDVVSDVQTPVSRAVYYSTWNHKDNWIIPIDIDAKDIAEREAVHAIEDSDSIATSKLLEVAGILETPPEGYKYTFQHVSKAITWAFEIKTILEDTFNFSDTMVVYSGQGAHVYGLDSDDMHKYDTESREILIYHLTEQYGYPIDEVVTIDDNRVIRLPYSLHSDVSRIVTPISSPDFDPRSQAKPQFLQEDESK